MGFTAPSPDETVVVGEDMREEKRSFTGMSKIVDEARNSGR
jgi:hypothetical protein